MGKKVEKFLLFLGVMVLVSEIIVRAMLSYDPYLNKIMGNNDSYWRLMWIKKQGEKHETKYYQPFDQFDPTKGWISKPNLRDFPAFNNKKVSTTSLGLRGLQEPAVGKNSERIRIITLGDSFTFGEDVDDRETYSYHLEKLLTGTEVINFGVHGYGYDQMLILLREHARQYRPDYVILSFLSLDMDRSIVGFRDYAKPQFVLHNGELKLKTASLPSPEQLKKYEFFKLKIIDVIKMIHAHYSQRRSENLNKMDIINDKIFQEIVAEIRKIGATPIFVYMPVCEEIYQRDPLLPYEKFLFDFCQRNQIDCTSVRNKFFDKIAERKTFGIGHWEPYGHEAVAEGLAEFLEKKGYVKPHS